MWLIKVQTPRLAGTGKPLFRVIMLSHGLSLDSTRWFSLFSFFQNFSQHSEGL